MKPTKLLRSFRPRPLVCALGLALTSLSQAATYYVSPSGNDSHTGLNSTTQAWKTVAPVNSHVYAAGDQILFQTGASFTGTIYLTATSIPSPSATNPVKLGIYGGTTAATISAGTANGIYIYNVGGVAVDSLIVTGTWDANAQTGSTGAGVLFFTDKVGAVKLPAIQITNCTVQNFKNGGIVIGSDTSDGSQSGYNGITLTKDIVHDNGDAGVDIYGEVPTAANSTYCHLNLSINNVQAYSNRGVSGKGAHSGDGIVIGQSSVGTIQNCVAYSNGDKSNYTGGGPVGIWCWDSKSLIFQFNESYQNTTGGTTPDGDGFDLDGGAVQCTMQYNYSHENHGAGFLIFEYGNARALNQGNIVRYNISQNDASNSAYSGIWTFGNCSNNRIYNNSIYTTNHLAIYTDEGSGNWFLNNIFYCNASSGGVVIAVGTSATNCKFINNDYYSGGHTLQLYYGSTAYSTLAAWRTATGFEKIGSVNYGFNTDPKFSSPGTGVVVYPNAPSTMTAYKLMSTSPMINAGYNLTTSPFSLSVGSRDFYGTTPFPNGAYDVGAHEYK